MAGGKSRALYRELAKEIADGRFAPLGAFPSEHMLAKRYEVSRETVRCAKKMLEETGVFAGIVGYRDLAGRDRIITGERIAEE